MIYIFLLEYIFESLIRIKRLMAIKMRWMIIHKCFLIFLTIYRRINRHFVWNRSLIGQVRAVFLLTHL